MTDVSAEPTEAASNGFRTRTGSAALLVPILLGLIWLGPWSWALTMGGLAFIGCLELGGLLSDKSSGNARRWGMSVLGVCAYSLSIRGLTGTSLPFLLPVTVGLCFCSLAFLFRPAGWTQGGLRRIVTHSVGVMYVCLFASFVTRIHAGTWPGSAPAEVGPRWVFLLLFLVFASDTGAYLVGVRWGRRRLWPAVSPKKSWEGLGGGIVFAVLMALGLNWGMKLGMSPAVTAGLGAVVGVAASLGDLIESRLKRETGKKDAGHWIPGHGGVLDRFDGLLFAAPLFYYYLQLIAR